MTHDEPDQNNLIKTLRIFLDNKKRKHFHSRKERKFVLIFFLSKKMFKNSPRPTREAFFA